MHFTITTEKLMVHPSTLTKQILREELSTTKVNQIIPLYGLFNEILIIFMDGDRN